MLFEDDYRNRRFGAQGTAAHHLLPVVVVVGERPEGEVNSVGLYQGQVHEFVYYEYDVQNVGLVTGRVIAVFFLIDFFGQRKELLFEVEVLFVSGLVVGPHVQSESLLSVVHLYFVVANLDGLEYVHTHVSLLLFGNVHLDHIFTLNYPYLIVIIIEVLIQTINYGLFLLSQGLGQNSFRALAPKLQDLWQSLHLHAFSTFLQRNDLYFYISLRLE